MVKLHKNSTHLSIRSNLSISGCNFDSWPCKCINWGQVTHTSVLKQNNISINKSLSIFLNTKKKKFLFVWGLQSLASIPKSNNFVPTGLNSQHCQSWYSNMLSPFEQLVLVKPFCHFCDNRKNILLIFCFDGFFWEKINV